MIARFSSGSRPRLGAIVGICGLVGVSAGYGAPAQAQDFMGAFRGAVGGLLGGGGYYGGGGGYHRRSGPARAAPAPAASTSTAPSADESTRALAALAPTTHDQLLVLKSVESSPILGEVGSINGQGELGQTTSREADRDYTAKIESLIKDIKSEQDRQKLTKEGDISEHGVVEALSDAYKQANLSRFETFRDENWSAEQLRGMVIDRVSNDIVGLFEGTNRGAVTMSELDAIIKKSAKSVYARLFETSELLAANRSSSLFVQRLYQTHGDLMQGQVREDAEELLLRASIAGVGAFDGLLRRDPNAYALRYRAQRIIFDCFSANIVAITSADNGIATPAEIEQRIADTDEKECSKWVAAQLQGPDGKVKPQEPMPLRVVWSAAGPKDDPSMYTEASEL
jgi:hypothetical protein